MDVVQNVTPSFDCKCRVKAIAMASALGLSKKFSVNCIPNAVLDPDIFVRATLIAEDHYVYDVANLIFGFTES
jgi:hypothetical protein